MYKIVTFCNSQYIPVTDNWLNFIKRNKDIVQNILIVTLDQESDLHFSNYNTIYRPINDNNNLNDLWIHRINIFYELLKEGIEIIHSDSDAIWLKNPIELIYSYNSDMVFSQGTIWPPDVYEKHKIVLCCGFFYLKPSDGIFTFLDTVKKRVIIEKDDQISVNRVISSWINEWEVNNPYFINFNKYSFKCSNNPIKAKTLSLDENNFEISILPHRQFPRILNNINDKAFVLHPLSGKNLRAKIDILSKLGLWSL